LIARRAVLPILAGGLSLRGEANYSARLWTLAKPIYEKTIEHPFLTGVADGSLPMEKFRYYMLQDAIYLGLYSKALSVLASKAPRDEWAMFFANGSINCIKTERKLHETYFQPQDLKGVKIAPTNAAYTNHLLATVHAGSFAEGLAAVTPCYWIYAEAGKELKKRGSKSNAYQRWIDQYAGEDFNAAVRQVLAMCDAVGPREPRFEELFVRSVRYEYLFWDMAWRLEDWVP
jgi:thiaminase/transcriptional activator TenA